MTRNAMKAVLCTLLLMSAAANAADQAGTSSYRAIGRFEDSPARTRATAPEILERFQAALTDAAQSDPARIYRDLVAVTEADKTLVWKGQGADKKVLTVVFTGYTGYDPLVGKSTTLTRDVWVMMAPQLKNFCATHAIPKEQLTLRLEQLIGLTPDGGRTRLVELWVSPDDLFRPSADPEITDHEAQLDFPASNRFLTISPDHIKWINDLKAISYLPTGMPWTRLGYTYDWGNPDTFVGLSEFVVRNGATVEVESTNAPADYCKVTTSSAPVFTSGDVTGLASGLGGAVAPAEHLSIAGRGLGGAGATKVYFDGEEATVALASGSEVHAMVPEKVNGRRSTTLVVEHRGVKSAPVTLPVVEARPGLFSSGVIGKSAVLALNQDGTYNSEQRPAVRGSLLTLLATGLGTSLAARVLGFPVPDRPVRVDFEGAPNTAEVLFAGMVYPGVAMVNVRIPPDAPADCWTDVYLSAGSSTSRAGTLVRIQ